MLTHLKYKTQKPNSTHLQRFTRERFLGNLPLAQLIANPRRFQNLSTLIYNQSLNNLQPITEYIFSYIKDTSYFLNKIKTIEHVPDESFLVTIDNGHSTMISLIPRVLPQQKEHLIKRQAKPFQQKPFNKSHLKTLVLIPPIIYK